MSDQCAKVYVEITSRCNLACTMCIRNAWDEPLGDMSREAFAGFLDQLGRFPGPITLVFGGYGEPFAHPHVFDMMASAAAAGLRVEAITNGTMIDGPAARELIRLGLHRLWFSIDGTTPTTYGDIRLGSDLEQVIDNVRGLFRLRLRDGLDFPLIGLVFVAMRSNVAEIPRLYNLAQLVRASDVMISNVAPHTPDMVDQVLYSRTLTMGHFGNSPKVPRLHMPRIDLDGPAGGPFVHAIRDVLDLTFAGADLANRTNYCPFVNANALAVRWDGAVSPCPTLLHSHPVHVAGRWKQVRHATFGNLATDSLAAIWGSAPYAGFRERVREFHFSPCVYCGGCDRSERNEEDCFGNTFPVCGGCLWAQGVLQCP